MRADWTCHPFEEVIDFQEGPGIMAVDFRREGVPLIRLSGLSSSGSVLVGCNYLDPEKVQKRWAHFRVERGDTLLSTSAALGRVAVVDEAGAGAIPYTGIIRMRPRGDELRREFIPYLLEAPEFQTQAEAVGIGSVMRHFGPSHLRRMTVTLPPIAAQRRIASILSAYDDLIENNTRRIQILEAMAQAIYREWFVEFRFPGHEGVRMVDSALGPIPEGWAVRNFTEVADVLSGGTPPTREKTFWNGDIPFFTPRDAPDTLAVLATERHITPEGLESCRSERFAAGTVFITARGTVGKVVTPAIPMALNQSCYAIRGRDGLSQDYLLYLLKNSVGYLTMNTGGATFDTIIIDTFRRMRVLHPPHPIINGFDQLAHPLRELEVRLLGINANLRQTRDLLLPRLISGEIDVSELDLGDV